MIRDGEMIIYEAEDIIKDNIKAIDIVREAKKKDYMVIINNFRHFNKTPETKKQLDDIIDLLTKRFVRWDLPGLSNEEGLPENKRKIKTDNNAVRKLITKRFIKSNN